MHIIKEKTDCNQKMKCGYLVPPKVGRTFFFYFSSRQIPIRGSVYVVLCSNRVAYSTETLFDSVKHVFCGQKYKKSDRKWIFCK